MRELTSIEMNQISGGTLIDVDLLARISGHATGDAVKFSAFTTTALTVFTFPAQWDPKLGIHVT